MSSDNPALFRYVMDHWQGRQPLLLSFWLNFVLLGMALNYLERFLLPPHIEQPQTAIIAALSYFVMVRLLIYPWQIVGLLRVCDRALTAIGGNLWARAAQGGVMLSLLFTMVMVFSTFQTLFVYSRQYAALTNPVSSNPQAGYSLSLIKDNTVIHLKGDFTPGITNAVTVFLQTTPGIRGILLDSDGGRIYEARGVARLVREYGLHTYSVAGCKSACTIAFISGSSRILIDNARLGFHQYKLDGQLAHPFINIQAEQEKDRALFVSQKVDRKFVRRIFDKPDYDIWFPTPEELLAAGVVHRFAALSEML
jgi:hypothetical protein